MSPSHSVKILSVTVACISSLLPLSAANLLVNSDFSQGTSGTFAAGSETTSNVVPTGWTGFATGAGSLKLNNEKVNFNGQDQATGSYIEQAVATTANLWYALDWDQTSHTGGDAAGVMMTSTLTSGGSSNSNSFRGLLSPQALILAGATTTIRLSDDGATTNSLDTRLDNTSFDLANGTYNMAHLATLSSSSQLSSSTWGREENAVDGRTQNSSNTVFHTSAAGYLDLDFTNNFAGATFSRIEIEARPGFNGRKGDMVQIFSTSGSVIESFDLSADNNSLFTASGLWEDVGNIRISESGQTLNVAEVRTFSNFVDGVAVPEPASTSLLALGSISLLLRRRR